MTSKMQPRTQDATAASDDQQRTLTRQRPVGILPACLLSLNRATSIAVACHLSVLIMLRRLPVIGQHFFVGCFAVDGVVRAVD